RRALEAESLPRALRVELLDCLAERDTTPPDHDAATAAVRGPLAKTIGAMGTRRTHAAGQRCAERCPFVQQPQAAAAVAAPGAPRTVPLAIVKQLGAFLSSLDRAGASPGRAAPCTDRGTELT